MTTVQKTLANDITRLRKESSYKEFEQGYFTNVPDLGGYLYKFKVDGANIVLIVNTSGSKYAKSYYHKNSYHFLIFKANSLKEFVDNLYGNISDIIDQVNRILDEEQENADIRAGGIPHGYKLDENGEIVVDSREAIIVRKIFKLYTQYGSIRTIARELKTNFSHVRDVLHDYRYEKMKQPIIPNSLLKKVRQLMDTNRKNRTT